MLPGREVMTGQAAVRLFQIDVQPGVGTIEGWRNLSGPESYRLCVAGQDWLMTPQTAARLGRVAGRLLRAPSKTGAANAGDAEREIKTGPMFTGRSQDGELMIELGIIDADAIYLQVGDAPKLCLTGNQAAGLLTAFALFEEVRTVVIAAWTRGGLLPSTVVERMIPAQTHSI